MRTEEWTPCELYAAYEAAREEAEFALADWSAAAAHARRDAFVVYRAAADREDTAALAWLRACEAYDAAQAPEPEPVQPLLDARVPVAE